MSVSRAPPHRPRASRGTAGRANPKSLLWRLTHPLWPRAPWCQKQKPTAEGADGDVDVRDDALGGEGVIGLNAEAGERHLLKVLNARRCCPPQLCAA